MRSKYRVPKVPRLARLLVPLFAVFWSCGSSSLEGPGEDDLAILFIGNSLTFCNDMPDILERLLEDADIGPVYVDMQAFPNWGLMDHWEDIRAHNLIEVGGWADGDTAAPAAGLGKMSFEEANLVLNGGTIRYTGSTTTGRPDRGFTIGAGGATLDASGGNLFRIAEIRGQFASQQHLNVAPFRIWDGHLQMVIAYRFDRVSRNSRDFHNICDQLEDLGVGVVSVTVVAE